MNPVESLLPHPRIADSTSRLCALSRLCIALHRERFVLEGGWQSLSATREDCLRQRDALCRVMMQKIRTALPVEEKCRLLSELHTLMGETDYVVNPRRQEAWDALADRVLTAFFALPAPVPSATTAAACRSLLDVYYFSVPDEDDTWWQFLTATLAAWASTFTDTDGWGREVPLSEALERIGLLNRYSYMYLDSRHDEVVRRAHRFYLTAACRDLSHCPPCAVERLYCLALEGNALPIDRRMAAACLDALQRQAAADPSAVDSLSLRAWQADWRCRAALEMDYRQETV